MRRIFLALGICTLASCSPMEPALSISDSPMMERYAVKGRQGWMINRELSFGEYQTSKVKSSWTRERNTRIANGYQIPERSYPDLITTLYKDRDQSYSFQMNDTYGNFSDVYATSAFHSKDLRLGDNKNSLGNILQDLFGKDYTENLFYLHMFLNDEESPWQLFLDNDAAQITGKEYEGIFALDADNYYILKPITEVQGKNGPQEVVLSSLGYEIFNKKNLAVAAVSLVDSGQVYFHTRDPKERFLLANLAAALLLQQDISDY